MRSILLASAARVAIRSAIGVAAVLVLSQPVLADDIAADAAKMMREFNARMHIDLENGLTRMQLYDAEERARDAALPMPSPTPAAPPSSSHDSYMEGYRDGHSDSSYGDGFTPHRY